MTFGPVTPGEIHATQIFTGSTMALFIAVRLLPGVRPYAMHLRLALVACYLLGCAGFAIYYLVLR